MPKVNRNSQTKRILFFGDGHADNMNPVMRKDDYMMACVEELQEGLQLARDYECDLFVHLGDVFHRLEVSGECRNLILSTLLYDENKNPWPFEKYTLVGNHDIKHNPQFLRASALGTLIKAGALKCVDELPEYRIGFGHFRNGIENEFKDGLLQKSNHLIWAVHANITVDDFFETADYVKFDELPLHDDCKLVVAGHIHFPLHQTRDDGKIYINPGSVTRREANSDNLQRKPKVLIVTYNVDGSDLVTTEVEMSSPRPADEIFKLEEIQARKDKKHDTQTFIQQISQISLAATDEDKYTVLKKAGRLKKIRDVVLNLAIETVKDVNDKRALKC